MNNPGTILVIVGAMAAGLGGVLIGFAGGLGMPAVQKGRRPLWLVPALNVATVLGFMATLAGIVTAMDAQPFFMWLGSSISGSVTTACAIALRRQIRSVASPNSSPIAGDARSRDS